MESCCKSCATGGSCTGGACAIKSDQLPGGLADNRDPESFDADALADGIAHELEHTNDRKVAEEIAMDHLVESGDYYTKLDAVEKAESIGWRLRKNFKVVRKINFQGLDVSIENDTGMVRKWKDRNGEEGETKMKYPYGYICRTDGADGEQVDVYVGPEKDSDKVYIVHQMAVPDFTKYDEDKVMIGFVSAREARSAYQMHYNDKRFLGKLTHTDIASFKRMFVKKSHIIEDSTPKTSTINEGMSILKALETEYASLQKSNEIGDKHIRKGVAESLKRMWSKIKSVFKKDKEKPTKTWVRNSSETCRTGVCDRLNGTTLPIDEKFVAMKGMLVDGPPAHLNCKCGLSFDIKKSLEDGTEETMGGPPGAPQMPPQAGNMQVQIDPMTGQPIIVDPHDCETYEGVNSLLSRIGGVKDPELMEIASRIWGDAYNYEGMSPLQARAELLGFLLDQRDLLGVEQMAERVGNEIDHLAPSPSLPVKTPGGSSDYSPALPNYKANEVTPDEVSSSEPGLQDPYFENSVKPNYSN